MGKNILYHEHNKLFPRRFAQRNWNQKVRNLCSAKETHKLTFNDTMFYRRNTNDATVCSAKPCCSNGRDTVSTGVVDFPQNQEVWDQVWAHFQPESERRLYLPSPWQRNWHTEHTAAVRSQCVETHTHLTSPLQFLYFATIHMTPMDYDPFIQISD